VVGVSIPKPIKKELPFRYLLIYLYLLPIGRREGR
jgi:hypothetical protein